MKRFLKALARDAPRLFIGKRISLNQLHEDTKDWVQAKYHDPALGEIDRADLVKGLQFEKAKDVIVETSELVAIQIESNKTINIEGFIDAGEVEELNLDSPDFLVADGPDGPSAAEAYAVICEALSWAKKVASARIVLSGRERMITIQPHGEGFLMTTLRSKDQVRDASKHFDEIDMEPDDDLLQVAEMIIAQKTMTFAATTFEDRDETAMLELIKAKIAGKDPVISKASEQGKVDNLKGALRASIEDESRTATASKRKAPARKAAAKAEAAERATRPPPRRTGKTAST